jgi:hypothetical protein
MTDQDQWFIYRGTGTPHDGISRLPAPPPWRAFTDTVSYDPPPADAAPNFQYLPDDDVKEMVNEVISPRSRLVC